MVTPLRQSCSSALRRLVLGRDTGCSSTHAGVGVPVRLCQMHRELHLTKRGVCGDRRNIIPFAHHHSRAFVLLPPASRRIFFIHFFKSCADLSRSGGELGRRTTANSATTKKKADACSPMVIFLVLKAMVLF